MIESEAFSMERHNIEGLSFPWRVCVLMICGQDSLNKNKYVALTIINIGIVYHAYVVANERL